MTASLSADGNVISARLMLTEQATVKPDLLLNTLAERAGVEPAEARIHRTALLAVEKNGDVVPLMEMKG